jgi:hypothetical protein
MSRGNKKKRGVSRPAARRATGPAVKRGINRPSTSAAALNRAIAALEKVGVQ